MQRFLSVLRKLLDPNGILLSLFCLVSAGGLFYVFANELSEHPLAIAAYVFSAYTLTAVVLRCICWMPKLRAGISAFPSVQRLSKDPARRRRYSLQRSFWIGLLLVSYKAIAGIYYQSAWFMAMAFYYAVLSVQRGLLLRVRMTCRKPIRAAAAAGACGWLMLLLSMAILGMRVLLFRDGERIVYPGHMIYAVALYAFYNATVAVVHLIRREKRDLLLLTRQRIHAASALVSMLFLQAALLAAFSEDIAAASYANLATGSVVALSTLVLGVYMIVNRSEEWDERERTFQEESELASQSKVCYTSEKQIL